MGFLGPKRGIYGSNLDSQKLIIGTLFWLKNFFIRLPKKGGGSDPIWQMSYFLNPSLFLLEMFLHCEYAWKNSKIFGISYLRSPENVYSIRPNPSPTQFSCSKDNCGIHWFLSLNRKFHNETISDTLPRPTPSTTQSFTLQIARTPTSPPECLTLL